jgi:UDP-N-acetylmuramate dehydrogenase
MPVRIAPERGIRLAPYTSLRVGGPAEYLLLATSAADVAGGLDWALERGLDVRIIGGGSNLLVAEPGVDGLVIKVAAARYAIEQSEDGAVVVAEAGANLANLARRIAKQGWSGLEWAANVPGTVGGATVNNAGAFGGDIASCLVSVDLVWANGRRATLASGDLAYVYRNSVLKQRALGDAAVERTTLRITPSNAELADSRVKQFNSMRMQTQPRISSAGSVFANPDGTYSGKLIDEAGLKGYRVGGAEISEQHANFIVNHGTATARAVYEVLRHTQDVVFEQTGIWLRPEIELFGRWTCGERVALRGAQAESTLTPPGPPSPVLRERRGRPAPRA